MVDFKSEDTGQMTLIKREKIDDEEDHFEAKYKLRSQGTLQDAGINGLMTQTKKWKSVVTIRTGIQALYELLGGEFETMCITEALGEFRSGKTQLAQTLCLSTQLPVNMRGGDGKVAYIETEGTFQPDCIGPIIEKFGMDPGAVHDNDIYAKAYTHKHQYNLLLRLAAKMAEESFRLLIVDSVFGLFCMNLTGHVKLAECQQKLAPMLSHLTNIGRDLNFAVHNANRGIKDGHLKKLQDAEIYTFSDQILQRKMWKSNNADALNTEVFVSDEDMIDEEGSDDDFSDSSPEEGDDIGADDEDFSGEGDYSYLKVWDNMGGYPIVFSKARESEVAKLFFLGTSGALSFAEEEWANCSLLASTFTGWLLFLKADGKSLLYSHVCSGKDYDLPALPDFVIEYGPVFGQWRADINLEPGKRNHRVTLIAKFAEGKKLCILSYVGRGWAPRTLDEDAPYKVITAGPILCKYLNSEQRLKFGLVWMEDYNALLTCRYDTNEIHQLTLPEFGMNLSVGLALTWCDGYLCLYQHNGRATDPNMVAVEVQALFSEHRLVREPVFLTLLTKWDLVENRRGLVTLRPSTEDDDEDHMNRYSLTFISRCGNHVCGATMRKNIPQWFYDEIPCDGCQHDLALFLETGLKIEGQMPHAQGNDNENACQDKEPAKVTSTGTWM